VRISAADVVSDMCETFGVEGWRAALSAVMEHLEEAGRLRSSGTETWWRRREASIYAVSVMCADCDVALVASIFQPRDFMQNVVLQDMAHSSPPVLRGRALQCVACFAEYIPTELAQQCFAIAVQSLGHDSSLPVQMTAARAIESLSSSENKTGGGGRGNGGGGGGGPKVGAEFMRPHVPMLLQRISVLLSSASEDSALITLEALHNTLKTPFVTTEEIAAQIPHVVEQILLALGRSAGDVMIATEAVEAIEAIVTKNDGEFVGLVANQCAPLCLSLMATPDRFVGTQAESIMELLAKIVKRPPGAASMMDNPLVSSVLPALVTTMLTCEVEDILQPGCACMRSYMREAFRETMSMEIQGKPMLECYVHIAVRMLRLGSEGSAEAASAIVAQLFLRCRAEVERFLPQLLITSLVRLRVARGQGLRQAIVGLFARLIVQDRAATILFLRQHSLSDPHQSALSLLLFIWARYQPEFCDTYQLNVTVAALGALLCSGDDELLR
jgi:hypothetical protein